MISQEFYDHLHELDRKYSTPDILTRRTTEENMEQIQEIENGDLENVKVNVSWTHIPDDDPDLVFCQNVAKTWEGGKAGRSLMGCSATTKEIDDECVHRVELAMKRGALTYPMIRDVTGFSRDIVIKIVHSSQYLMDLKKRYAEILRGYVVISMADGKMRYRYFKDISYCCQALQLPIVRVQELANGKVLSKKFEVLKAADWYHANLIGGIIDEKA